MPSSAGGAALVDCNQTPSPSPLACGHLLALLVERLHHGIEQTQSKGVLPEGAAQEFLRLVDSSFIEVVESIPEIHALSPSIPQAGLSGDQELVLHLESADPSHSLIIDQRSLIVVQVQSLAMELAELELQRDGEGMQDVHLGQIEKLNTTLDAEASQHLVEVKAIQSRIVQAQMEYSALCLQQKKLHARLRLVKRSKRMQKQAVDLEDQLIAARRIHDEERAALEEELQMYQQKMKKMRGRRPAAEKLLNGSVFSSKASSLLGERITLMQEELRELREECPDQLEQFRQLIQHDKYFIEDSMKEIQTLLEEFHADWELWQEEEMQYLIHEMREIDDRMKEREADRLKVEEERRQVEIDLQRAKSLSQKTRQMQRRENRKKSKRLSNEQLGVSVPDLRSGEHCPPHFHSGDVRRRSRTSSMNRLRTSDTREHSDVETQPDLGIRPLRDSWTHVAEGPGKQPSFQLNELTINTDQHRFCALEVEDNQMEESKAVLPSQKRPKQAPNSVSRPKRDARVTKRLSVKPGDVEGVMKTRHEQTTVLGLYQLITARTHNLSLHSSSLLGNPVRLWVLILFLLFIWLLASLG